MNRIRQFMYGRYGMDQLGFALVIFGCIITFVLSLFGLRYRGGWGALIFRVLGMFPYLVFVLRALSKDIEKRRAENMRFLKVWSPCAAFFSKKEREVKHEKYFSHWRSGLHRLKFYLL